MKRLAPYWIIALLTACPAAYAAEPPTPELFAAMIMTKQQQASAVPTSSGVLWRAPKGAWSRLGPEIQLVSSATVDPHDPAHIFLACGNGIVRSRDGGETWRMVTGWREADVLQIVVDPQSRENVYAATAWGVLVSHDGGESWRDASEGLPAERLAKGIAIDPRNPARLLLATTTGLFESTNCGAVWRRVDGFPEVAALRICQSETDLDRWLVGTEGRGVWRSRDNGHTWSPCAPALAQANVYAVAVAPHDADLLAAGGWTTGVWFSRDGGDKWQPAATALPSANITAMTFDPVHRHRLWASTFEEGTFYTEDFGATWHSAHLDGAYVFDLGFLDLKR